MVDRIDMLERDERAAEAQALLNNPLLTEIFQRVEKDAQDAMLSSEPGSAVAVAYHQRIMAIRAIHADLIRLVDDPKMLRAAADRRRRLSQ